MGAAKVRGEIMTESKTDLRVVRTRKLIRDAFMDMVGEVGVARITVKDLTERAGINRKTFYLHFESIEALYDSVMNEVMNDFFDNYETTADQPKDLAVMRSVSLCSLSGKLLPLRSLSVRPDPTTLATISIVSR
mgnify:CR=1 FL=1